MRLRFGRLWQIYEQICMWLSLVERGRGLNVAQRNTNERDAPRRHAATTGRTR
jgi:hypothetical protein